MAELGTGQWGQLMQRNKQDAWRKFFLQKKSELFVKNK